MTKETLATLSDVSDTVAQATDALEAIRAQVTDRTSMYDMLYMVAFQQLLTAKLVLTMMLRVETARTASTDSTPVLIGEPVAEPEAPRTICEDCAGFQAPVGNEPYRLCPACNRKLRRNRR